MHEQLPSGEEVFILRAVLAKDAFYVSEAWDGESKPEEAVGKAPLSSPSKHGLTAMMTVPVGGGSGAACRR
jgi:hypothetical protein